MVQADLGLEHFSVHAPRRRAVGHDAVGRLRGGAVAVDGRGVGRCGVGAGIGETSAEAHLGEISTHILQLRPQLRGSSDVRAVLVLQRLREVDGRAVLVCDFRRVTRRRGQRQLAHQSRRRLAGVVVRSIVAVRVLVLPRQGLCVDDEFDLALHRGAAGRGHRVAALIVVFARAVDEAVAEAPNRVAGGSLLFYRDVAHRPPLLCVSFEARHFNRRRALRLLVQRAAMQEQVFRLRPREVELARHDLQARLALGLRRGGFGGRHNFSVVRPQRRRFC
mmetsp:Transcript_13235/g.44240  ORF Transcript_13235/g.44240 Transcript_13235/m.44240 type:complete len:277 (-) Transcript_13235:2307-3137(-)